MGRPFKNHCEEIYIGNIRDRKFGLWQVKIPFFTKVTYKIVVSENKKINKKWYGTAWDPVNKPISKKDEIIKDFLEKGKEVINIEEYYIQFLDICPLCHNKGTPKIERKDTSDNRWRVSPQNHTKIKTKPDVYRLTYTHKNNKCIISHFDKNHFLFKKNPKRNIELEKHFFPMCLEWIEKSVLLRLV